MTELDQIWSEMLNQAAAKAIHSGEHGVADYLRLKAANDAVRSIGVNWLVDTFIEFAGHETRKHNALTIERLEPHNFAHGQSNMVGTRLDIRHGVRCLSVEAGWARTPGDGIMRNGALAIACIRHYGLARHDAEFRLVHGKKLPKWLGQDDADIDSNELRRHFDLLLDR